MKRTCLCGVVNDATMHVQGKEVEPVVGDYSICSTCFRVSRFTETGYDFDAEIPEAVVFLAKDLADKARVLGTLH